MGYLLFPLSSRKRSQQIAYALIDDYPEEDPSAFIPKVYQPVSIRSQVDLIKLLPFLPPYFTTYPLGDIAEKFRFTGQ